MPLEAPHEPRGQLRRRLLRAARRVEQVQHAQARLVRDEGDRLPVGRALEAVHVPRDLRRQVRVLPGREIDVGEAPELRVAVGRDVEPLAVGAEADVVVGDLLRALRRDERPRAARQVDEPDVALVDREGLDHGELRVVWGPVGRPEAASLHLEHHASRRRVVRVHHVDVAVGAVAARRAEGHEVAPVRPRTEVVLRAPAGRDRRDRAGRHVEAVDLGELVAPLVLGEHDAVGRVARPARARDTVREERELPPRTEREPDLVDLRRVAEAGRDEHLAPRGMPGHEARRAELGVAAHGLGDLGGDLRETVADEVVSRPDDTGGRGDARGGRGLLGACASDEQQRRQERDASARGWYGPHGCVV